MSHKDKGKVVMIRIKEQRVSRFAQRPGDSAQAENVRKLWKITERFIFTGLLSDIIPLSTSCFLVLPLDEGPPGGRSTLDEGPPGGRRALVNLPEISIITWNRKKEAQITKRSKVINEWVIRSHLTFVNLFFILLFFYSLHDLCCTTGYYRLLPATTGYFTTSTS